MRSHSFGRSAAKVWVNIGAAAVFYGGVTPWGTAPPQAVFIAAAFPLAIVQEGADWRGLRNT